MALEGCSLRSWWPRSMLKLRPLPGPWSPWRPCSSGSFWDVRQEDVGLLNLLSASLSFLLYFPSCSFFPPLTFWEMFLSC